MARYGDQDASFMAAGQQAGITKLVQAFYEHMDSLTEATTIRNMHPVDLDLASEKLQVFLTGWLGGPREYANKFGPIHIPHAHAHLDIDEAERDAWMLCMQHAVAEQDAWDDDFKEYFLGAISVPAERIRQASVARRG